MIGVVKTLTNVKSTECVIRIVKIPKDPSNARVWMDFKWNQIGKLAKFSVRKITGNGSLSLSKH